MKNSVDPGSAGQELIKINSQRDNSFVFFGKNVLNIWSYFFVLALILHLRLFFFPHHHWKFNNRCHQSLCQCLFFFLDIYGPLNRKITYNSHAPTKRVVQPLADLHTKDTNLSSQGIGVYRKLQGILHMLVVPDRGSRLHIFMDNRKLRWNWLLVTSHLRLRR